MQEEEEQLLKIEENQFVNKENQGDVENERINQKIMKSLQENINDENYDPGDIGEDSLEEDSFGDFDPKKIELDDSPKQITKKVARPMINNNNSDVFNFDEFEIQNYKKNRASKARVSVARISKTYTKSVKQSQLRISHRTLIGKDVKQSVKQSQEMMDVVYDPQLKCYYNPKTNEYYELIDEQPETKE